MRSRRFLLALAALGWASLAWLASHAALELVARRVETRLDATLWGNFDEHRQVLVPTNHVGRGARRVMITGPSEAREGFLPEVIEAGLPGWRVYQASVSMGVASDVQLMLEYLERAYGRAALPEVLVVGLTPRFAAEVGSARSPLAATIAEYSARFDVVDGTASQRLAPRSLPAGLAARARFLSKQGLRYRNALRALAAAGPSALLAAPGVGGRLGHPFAAARYGTRAPWDTTRVRERLDQPNNHLRHTAELDYAQAAARITRALRDLVEGAERAGVRIFFVGLPERSEVRALYDAAARALYEDALEAGRDGAPLLQMRNFLDDREFFDSHHPSARGAARMSERLASELRSRLAGG